MVKPSSRTLSDLDWKITFTTVCMEVSNLVKAKLYVAICLLAKIVYGTKS